MNITNEICKETFFLSPEIWRRLAAIHIMASQSVTAEEAVIRADKLVKALEK